MHVARRPGIIDAAPTILAMLGLRIPDDMEGTAITELFDPPLTCEKEAAASADGQVSDDQVYSEEEQRLLTERLSDLGYLE